MNRKVLILLFIVICLVFVGKAIRIVRSSLWDGTHHINIAIDNGDVEIWSIEPSKKTAYLIIVPKDATLLLPGYGTYKAGSVGRLSLLERKNGKLLKTGLQETLAIPIDATMVRKKEESSHFSLEDFFGLQALPTVLLHHTFSQDYLTDLSTLDIFRLWLFSFSLKKEAVEKIDASGPDVSTKETLPDGGEMLIIDSNRFSKLAQRYFADATIEKEQQTIEVFNGTDVAGRATSLSLLLQNIGGNVINTGKSENLAGRSIVFAKKGSYTASKIADITGSSFSDSPPKESRADILIVLGDN